MRPITSFKQLVNFLSKLPPDSVVYGVIGLTRTISHLFYRDAFVAQGFNGVFLHLKIPLKEFDAVMILLTAQPEKNSKWVFGGLAVTSPYKERVVQYITEPNKLVQAIGCANTIRIRSGRVFGYNTDVKAFLAPLYAEKIDFGDYSVGVIGTGGAARAIIHALTEIEPVKSIRAISRTPAKAKQLVTEFGIDGWSRPETIPRLNILINATPVGMSENPNRRRRVVPEETFQRVTAIAYDLSCRHRTLFMEDAADVQCTVIDGRKMFEQQALEQFTLLTDIEGFSDPMMRSIMDKHFG